MIFASPSQQAYAMDPKIAVSASSTLTSEITVMPAQTMPTMKQVMPVTACRNPLTFSSMNRKVVAVNG